MHLIQVFHNDCITGEEARAEKGEADFPPNQILSTQCMMPFGYASGLWMTDVMVCLCVVLLNDCISCWASCHFLLDSSSVGSMSGLYTQSVFRVATACGATP